MTGRRTGLVIDEKILVAAAPLPQDGFTAEELVVATFCRFPEDFCLKGFADYPDSNKVLTQVTTAGRGLQRRGWLVQIGTKRYKLTGEGYRHLERLGTHNEVPGLTPDNRDVIDLVLHWAESQALDLFRRGRQDDVNERQALTYWKLTAGSSAARTHRMLAVASTAAALLEDAVTQGKEVRLSHNRRLSAQEAELLVAVHQFLTPRFKEAVAFLKSQRK